MQDIHEFYECEDCGRFTTKEEHVHLARRRGYDETFGTFTQTLLYTVCCACLSKRGGHCGGSVLDHWNGLRS